MRLLIKKPTYIKQMNKQNGKKLKTKTRKNKQKTQDTTNICYLKYIIDFGVIYNNNKNIK